MKRTLARPSLWLGAGLASLVVLGLGAWLVPAEVTASSKARPASAPVTAHGAPDASANVAAAPTAEAQQAAYRWLQRPPAPHETLESRLPAPFGFKRVAAAPDSFAEWLRQLPMQPKGSPVRSFDGDVLVDDPVAVIALDVGDRDLQQCADSIIRLRAEFLWSAGRRDDVAFHFTDGSLARWPDYRKGHRPQIKDGKIKGWAPRRKQDGSRKTFGRYLRLVMGWAGTFSLDAYSPSAEGTPVRAGDFYVRGGFPGHAVMVLDVAKDRTGRTAVLIGQGYMPAQSFHVIAPRVQDHPGAGAWHVLDEGRHDGGIDVPTWSKTFGDSTRKRFDEQPAPVPNRR